VSRLEAARRARAYKRQKKAKEIATTVVIWAGLSFATFYASYGLANWVVGL
jgi:hypothetical protein